MWPVALTYLIYLYLPGQLNIFINDNYDRMITAGNYKKGLDAFIIVENMKWELYFIEFFKVCKVLFVIQK